MKEDSIQFHYSHVYIFPEGASVNICCLIHSNSLR